MKTMKPNAYPALWTLNEKIQPIDGNDMARFFLDSVDLILCPNHPAFAASAFEAAAFWTVEFHLFKGHIEEGQANEEYIGEAYAAASELMAYRLNAEDEAGREMN